MCRASHVVCRSSIIAMLVGVATSIAYPGLARACSPCVQGVCSVAKLPPWERKGPGHTFPFWFESSASAGSRHDFPSSQSIVFEEPVRPRVQNGHLDVPTTHCESLLSRWWSVVDATVV